MPAGVRCGWTTRTGGYSQGALASNNMARHVGGDDAVDANRALLRSRLPGQPRLSWLNQTHSTAVVPAALADPSVGQDGSVTTEPNLTCCVMTADCLPVFLWDASGEQVAAIHAGWRGLAEGILIQALSWFENPNRIYAGIGPAISQQHFEVGNDVRTAFQNWPNADSCFIDGVSPSKYQCDLPGLARAQLINAGVQQVYLSGICTYANEDKFYSYRRDGLTGRMANLIWKTT